MTPQDFKAFLDVLNRIATALEGKDKNIAVETVNRFAEVYRMLDTVRSDDWREGNRVDDFKELRDYVSEIQQAYVKIATEILQINQQK